MTMFEPDSVPTSLLFHPIPRLSRPVQEVNFDKLPLRTIEHTVDPCNRIDPQMTPGASKAHVIQVVDMQPEASNELSILSANLKIELFLNFQGHLTATFLMPLLKYHIPYIPHAI